MNEIEEELTYKIIGKGTAAKLRQHPFRSEAIIQKLELGKMECPK